ncbi:MAG: lysoplasmalogenase [Anaerolineae bacterium]|nr:lysoplasmalogenase [Anaerolineae bacterium]
MTTSLFIILAVITAALELWGEHQDSRKLIYVFKPATTLLILLVALTTAWGNVGRYTGLILIGLVFSTIGDILLMLPSDQFVPGLGSFLAAQLCYAAAYTTGHGFAFTWWLLACFSIYGIALVRYLWPKLGKMRVPVIAYAAVILTMGWQAWERVLWNGGARPLLAALGALLFIASDSVIAIARFRVKSKHTRLPIMITYYLGQLLIALSAGQ